MKVKVSKRTEQGTILDSVFCVLRKIFKITPFRFTLFWAIIFVFGPVLIGSCSVPWYLVGTVMGAALMVVLYELDRGQG